VILHQILVFILHKINFAFFDLEPITFIQLQVIDSPPVHLPKYLENFVPRSMAKVTKQFSQKGENKMDIELNEVVLLMEAELDGWVYASNLSQTKFGFIPFICVQSIGKGLAVFVSSIGVPPELDLYPGGFCAL
jgi:hypothetical protein